MIFHRLVRYEVALFDGCRDFGECGLHGPVLAQSFYLWNLIPRFSRVIPFQSFVLLYLSRCSRSNTEEITRIRLPNDQTAQVTTAL